MIDKRPDPIVHPDQIPYNLTDDFDELAEDSKGFFSDLPLSKEAKGYGKS